VPSNRGNDEIAVLLGKVSSQDLKTFVHALP
jgi:hypothetical protein